MAVVSFPQTDAVPLDLLEKYNTQGPRYTSYPTAPVWTEAFGPQAFRQEILNGQTYTPQTAPLSLYVHVPFCESRCLFCGCNVVITRQKEQAEKYLDYLFREVDQTAGLIQSERPVVQYHWGGGTPTYLSLEQMERLFTTFQKRFRFSPDAEIAIEIDPRVTSLDQLKLLKDLGFNRVSLGVQDFETEVQEAVHRIQPVGMTQGMVEDCRALGFESINFDLIYGLPHQTEITFAKTLETVLDLSPDRIALYNYAHVPWISPHQKDIPESALPSGPQKFRIFQQALSTLTQAGYVYIGLDHFAKPQDELSQALSEGRLSRNFMGYTVLNARQEEVKTELFGFGVSAISSLAQSYAQNRKKLSEYYEALDAGQFPTVRGHRMSAEDCLRQQVILAILCQGKVNYSWFLQRFNLDFTQHFAEPLALLTEPTQDGLLTFEADGFYLTALGRIFSRNIAMAFDAYLPDQTREGRHRMFSRTL